MVRVPREDKDNLDLKGLDSVIVIVPLFSNLQRGISFMVDK